MDKYSKSDLGKVKQENDVFYSYVKIPNDYGIHARPSALIVNVSKRYDAQITLYHLQNDLSANAKSIMDLMALEGTLNDILRVDSTGEDAEPALDEIIELIQNGFNEL
jgi:phosphotransferase system HPr (HPr) family protein